MCFLVVLFAHVVYVVKTAIRTTMLVFHRKENSCGC